MKFEINNTIYEVTVNVLPNAIELDIFDTDTLEVIADKARFSVKKRQL